MGTLSVTRLTGTIGAVVEGIDACRAEGDQLAELRAAVDEHGVVFLADQHMSDEEHIGLASRFGSLSVYPVLRLAGIEQPLELIEDTESDPPKADRWHTDQTWVLEPPQLAFLSALVVPDHGGDTVWTDTAGAFEALSPTMQELVSGLWVRHRVEPESFERFESRFGPEVGARFRAEYGDGVEHPLVRTHPVTGRPSLFLAGYWMDGIVGMTPAESRALLGFLMDHAVQPRFQVRWRWRVGDLAIWDERRTMHMALPDHFPQRRLVRRCTVDGERPFFGAS